jgi:hypothetical protein
MHAMEHAGIAMEKNLLRVNPQLAFRIFSDIPIPP